MRNLRKVDDWGTHKFRVYEDVETGDLFPSITTILDLIVPKRLKEYIAKTDYEAGKEVLRVKGLVGTRRDEIFTSIMNGKKIETTKEEEPFVEVFHQLVGRHFIVPVSTQQTIYSERYGFAGTTDLIAYFTACSYEKCCYPPYVSQYQNRLCILDYKTGYYGPKATAQMWGYKTSYEEINPALNDLGIVGLSLPQTRLTSKCIITGYMDRPKGMMLGALECFKSEYFRSFFKDKELTEPRWKHVKELSWETK